MLFTVVLCSNRAIFLLNLRLSGFLSVVSVTEVIKSELSSLLCLWINRDFDIVRDLVFEQVEKW